MAQPEYDPADGHRHVSTHLEHADTHADTLDRAAAGNQRQRRIVASHPNTDARTLHRLSADPDTGVRWAVAAHPNTAETTITTLEHDPNPSVANAATDNHTRRNRTYINTLSGDLRTHAELLAAAGFTGWPTDLAALLPTITSGCHRTPH